MTRLTVSTRRRGKDAVLCGRVLSAHSESVGAQRVSRHSDPMLPNASSR